MGFVLALAATIAVGAPVPESPAAPVRLQWDAPEGCPDAQAVLAWVEALAPAAGSADARATVVLEGGEYVLQLEITGDATVTRTLQASDCRVVGRAAAVVIAVSLDPIAVAQTSAVTTALAGDEVVVPEPAPVVEPLPELPPERTVPPRITTPARDDREPSTLEYGAGIGVGIDGLLLPRTGAGLSLTPFVGTRRIHVEAALQYWMPHATNSGNTRDVQAELQMVTAGVRACPLLEWGRVRVPLCAGIDAGGVFARARGGELRNGQPAAGPWAGVILAPGVRVSVARRVSVGLSVEGVISLYRPRFGVAGLDRDLWVVGAGGIRGVLGVQIHAARQKK